jgi:hypothetical protein
VKKHQTSTTVAADKEGGQQGGPYKDCQVAVLASVPTDRRSEKGMASVRKGLKTANSPHLRVYSGPSEEDASVEVLQSQQPKVTVPLGEVLPLLADAVRSDRTWLRDFAQDEITISMDLYEVILAYQFYRRPSA